MYIKHTIQWINSFVIALNLCPFAKREMDQESARFQVGSSTTVEQGLTEFMEELEVLNTSQEISTSLLIFPHFLSNFQEYMDFVVLANLMIDQLGLRGTYQLATFHPHYCFADTDAEDVTNYTNRSPYPMLHILREELVEKAIAYYGNTDIIPENNIIHLQSLGLDKVKKLLNN